MPIETSNDIIQMILHAGLMVRFVLLLLVFFSVASWTIIFAKYRTIKKAVKESEGFLEQFWSSRSLSDALVISKDFKGSPVARVFRVA